MAVGTLTAQYLDEFPKATRAPGSGRPKGRLETDVDIVLKSLQEENTVPSRVLMFMDYNFETDENGATSPVDNVTARKRASGRVGNLRARGYTKETGWVIKAINGACYAQIVAPEVNGSLEAIGEPDSVPATV